MRPRAFAGAVASPAPKRRSQGMWSARLAATAKHFPGLGRADVNTDDATATSTPELGPFRAAIGAGVPLMMLSHALYPGLDTHRIASQSPRIATDLLRDDLGFDGVAITDSLEAQAVLDRSGVARRSRAVAARGSRPDPHDRQRQLEGRVPAAARTGPQLAGRSASECGAQRPACSRSSAALGWHCREPADVPRGSGGASPRVASLSGRRRPRAPAPVPSARGAPSGCRRGGAPRSRPGAAPRRRCRRRGSARACPRSRRAAPGPRSARAAPRGCRGCAASGRPTPSTRAAPAPRRKPYSRECSRKRPTTDVTRMFSDTPGTPGAQAADAAHVDVHLRRPPATPRRGRGCSGRPRASSA